MIKEAIEKIVSKQDLTYDEAYTVMNEIMNGETTQVQNAAYLAALSTKSTKAETIDEISGSAMAMRDHALKVEHEMDVLDIVGTGGDHAHSINISTTAAMIIAAAGVKVAKYANRVLVMSNKKIAMYDTVEKVFARAPELLELGLSVPQVTKIFLKLREMGVDVPADVYTIPYAVKTLLEAKRRRDAGESLVLPRSAAQKGGAV